MSSTTDCSIFFFKTKSTNHSHKNTLCIQFEEEDVVEDSDVESHGRFGRRGASFWDESKLDSFTFRKSKRERGRIFYYFYFLLFQVEKL